MILYLNLGGPETPSSKLETTVKQNMPDLVESLTDLEALRKRIQTRIFDINIIIIELDNSSPVDELLEFKEELKDLKTILILNDLNQRSRVNELFQLYPRHVAFDNNSDKIMSIINNQLRFIKKKFDTRGTTPPGND